MKKKLLFIFNPHSGKGLIKNKLLEIVDIMVKADYEVTIYPTQSKGDAQNHVREEAKNYDLIVCSGGDGTLDEAVSGMMESEEKTLLGYIPAGSTNDFANSLRIPKSMLKAANVAVKGRRFPVDIGYFNGDSFVYVAAFGLFTAVSYQTSQQLKNVLGHAAYILEGMKQLLDIPVYKMRVEYDDEVLEDEFIYGMITNSISVGGFKNLTGKNVLLDDGVFEVTLIKAPKNPLELNEIIAALTSRKDDTDLVYSFKSSNIKFYPEEIIPWTLDGEFGGDHKEVEIRNMHQALEIMVKNKETDCYIFNFIFGKSHGTMKKNNGGIKMLVSATEMLKKAKAGHYAVGQFNINNLEWTKSILLTAEELKSPVILGVSEGAGKYMTGFKTVAAMVKAMDEELGITVPVALHLDHGTYEGCYKCIKAGFTSIMFDGSHYPFEENLAKSTELVNVAHQLGLSIECEVGSIGGEEDGVVGMGECADPNECKTIADLGVDMLAAGIGNIHGKYPANWKGLSFETLDAIQQKTGTMPLVLHGGTGIPADMIKKAISLGVSKINVNTECQLSFADATRKYIEAGKDLEGKGFDPRKLLAPGAEAIKATVKEKMELFGSVGKAE